MSKAVDEFSKAKQFISHPTVHQKPLHEILENYHQSRLKDEWISITDELPKYDPKHQKAFDILIKASNERYYVGYPVTEYSETEFHQHNGRKILNVTHWMPLPR